MFILSGTPYYELNSTNLNKWKSSYRVCQMEVEKVAYKRQPAQISQKLKYFTEIQIYLCEFHDLEL